MVGARADTSGGSQGSQTPKSPIERCSYGHETPLTTGLLPVVDPLHSPFRVANPYTRPNRPDKKHAKTPCSYFVLLGLLGLLDLLLRLAYSYYSCFALLDLLGLVGLLV